MSYERTVKELAPCGIDCSRCVSYEKGDVVKLSKELRKNLVNFENMAMRFKKFSPVFNSYDQFAEVLEHFSKGNCPGCRNGEVPNTACAAKTCHKAQNVDFCYQCSKYPCNENGYNEYLYNKWKKNNDTMKMNGVESFYIDQKKKPRY